VASLNRVLLSIAHPNGRQFCSRLGRSARAFLSKLGQKRVELSLSLVTDRQIRRLNRTFRGKDKATDVLSFPASEPLVVGTHRLLGDVVISLDTAARRSQSDRLKISRELDHYLAHGVLHILGYDHHRRSEARRMARAERRLLGRPGMLPS